MAKNRKINNSLTRVLEQSDTIVYLVAENGELVYANEACAAWVGLDLETLIETELLYSSEVLTDPHRDAAKGLAIPPQWIAHAGQQQTPLDWKISCSRGSQLDFRTARAMPLFESEQCTGYLVIASSDAADNNTAMPDPLDAIDSPLLQHEALARVRQQMQKRFDSKRLVGTSATAQRVRRQLRAAATSESDVLLVGPEGSGREHIARALFFNADVNANANANANASGSGSSGDGRADADEAALIPIHGSITDPAQIQRTMKEVLSRNRKSARSTLLLIDVDKMAATSQQELLGYLRLKGLSPRIIATASHELIGSRDFDDLLAERLCTHVIKLAPLSRRREDLPLIAQAILESKNEQGSRTFSGFTRQASEMICEYDWPGNFGQLAAAIDEAANNASGPILSIDDFSADFHHAIKAQRFEHLPETKIQLDEYLLDVESQLVSRAIAQAKGNKTKAAELLGISRGKLLRRLALFEQPTAEETDPQPTSSDAELLDSSVFEESKDE